MSMTLEPMDASLTAKDLGAIRGLPAAERDATFLSVEREIRRLQGIQTAMIVDVEDSGVHLDDGHRTAASWVQAVLNTSSSIAERLVHTARLLRDMPIVSEGVADGSIGGAQLDLLCRLHRNPLCREHLPDGDALLAEHARTFNVREFAAVCQRFNAHADPDGARPVDEAARDGRSITFSRRANGWRLTAQGDRATGRAILRLLRAQSNREYDRDVARRREQHPDDPLQHPLARTREQRVHDAFVALVTGAAHGHGVQPVVNILCTEAALVEAIADAHPDAPRRRRRRRRPVVRPTEQVDGPAALFDPMLRVSETDDGEPIDAHELFIAALIGQVRRVVVDSNRRSVDLGRKRRLFTGAAREAALLADGHCSFNGCNALPDRLQLDHITPWASMHGSTDLDNAAPACGHHNRSKHTTGQTTRRDATGWRHFRSDGTEIAPRPQPKARPDPPPDD